jgi:hypothetical protein
MRAAAKAFYFEVGVTGIEGVAERRGRLGGSLEGQHALIPGFAGKPISLALGQRVRQRPEQKRRKWVSRDFVPIPR